MNSSANATMNNANNTIMNTSRSNYGFTVDKLNYINDIEYDRDNMIADEDEINEDNHILDYENESDLEL